MATLAMLGGQIFVNIVGVYEVFFANNFSAVGHVENSPFAKI